MVSGDREGSGAEGAPELPPVPGSGLAGLAAACGFVVAGTHPGPRRHLAGGGEHGHAGAGSAMIRTHPAPRRHLAGGGEHGHAGAGSAMITSGVFGGHDSLEFAACFGEPSVLDVEERAGVAGDRQGRRTEGSLQPPVPGRVLLDFTRPADS